MKNVSYVLTQSGNANFYFRGGFEIEANNDEICEVISDQVLKFFARVRKYRMKTNFKFGKKFTIRINIDGKTYESTDLFYKADDSGNIFEGAISLAKNRTENFVYMVFDTVENA